MPDGVTSMNIFKLYLGQILGQCDSRSDSTADNGPLQLYHQHPRSEIGAVLTSRSELESPGQFIPKFYKECTFINVKACTEVRGSDVRYYSVKYAQYGIFMVIRDSGVARILGKGRAQIGSA